MKMFRNQPIAAFTLVELMMAMTIMGIMMALFISNLSTNVFGDNVTRAVNSIYGDMMQMRMRAVSLNTKHRLRFSSTTEWRIEIYTGALPPDDWELVGMVKRMPADSSLTLASYTNAGSNLEAKSNGLYEFLSGMSGSPYVTIQNYDSSKTRSIEVAQGGAVKIE